MTPNPGFRLKTHIGVVAGDAAAVSRAVRAIFFESDEKAQPVAAGCVTVREFGYGLVRIEFMGEVTAGRVIYADPGTEQILGVTALEAVDIVVDPANKTLKRLPAILLN
jgi:predicted aspartyl protease